MKKIEQKNNEKLEKKKKNYLFLFLNETKFCGMKELFFLSKASFSFSFS
jgi:hypothetical protein